MLIFSVSFQTLTETRKVKRIQNHRDAQGHSDARACSPDSDAVDHNSRDIKDTRVSAGSRRIKYRARNSSAVDQTAERPRKARVLVATVCHVTRSLRQPNVGTRFQKNGINVKLERVATFVRCPTKDVLKFRVKIEIC